MCTFKFKNINLVKTVDNQLKRGCTTGFIFLHNAGNSQLLVERSTLYVLLAPTGIKCTDSKNLSADS